MSKACEYIKELRQSNLKLGEDIGTLDRLRMDNQLLRQEVRRCVCYSFLSFQKRNCEVVFFFFFLTEQCLVSPERQTTLLTTQNLITITNVSQLNSLSDTS